MDEVKYMDSRILMKTSINLQIGITYMYAHTHVHKKKW